MIARGLCGGPLPGYYSNVANMISFRSQEG
jgi:hypothetical protein